MKNMTNFANDVKQEDQSPVTELLALNAKTPTFYGPISSPSLSLQSLLLRSVTRELQLA